MSGVDITKSEQDYPIWMHNNNQCIAHPLCAFHVLQRKHQELLVKLSAFGVTIDNHFSTLWQKSSWMSCS